jgi:GWxTD domain-containing protein
MKLNFKLYYLVLFLLLQGIDISAKYPSFSYDYAIFRYDENNVKIELYYSFPDTLLKYKYTGDKYTGELKFEIEISSAIKKEIQDSWIVAQNADKPITEFSSNLVGQRNFILPYGQYSAKLKIKDENDSSTNASYDFRLITGKFPNDKISMSSIQLAQQIEDDTSRTNNWLESFRKNSYFVIPNPMSEYYSIKPQLFAYLEIYNAKSISSEGYYINYKVLDALNREVFVNPRKKNSNSDGVVDIVELPLEVLPTGVFFLQMTLSYPINEVTDSISEWKKFYYFNPQIKPQAQAQFIESESFEASEFSTMFDERINREFDMASCIATRDEKDQFEMLTTTTAKQRFMFRFWNNRDPKPSTIENERLTEFRKAVDFADRFFYYGLNNNGWKTDRGRILLKYGFPGERIQHTAQGNLRAYEEWFYGEIQGGIHFYFVDMLGYNNYILVHSTALNEYSNPDWYNQYVPTFKDPLDLKNTNTNTNTNPTIISPQVR